jgi:hypothetical protein
MASSYDRITRREEVNELFLELGQVLGRKVEALLAPHGSGAVLRWSGD